MGNRGRRRQIIFLNGTSSSGQSGIADHVLSEPWRLRDCLEVMAGYRVVFVGVRCSPAELERREGERGDRLRSLLLDRAKAGRENGSGRDVHLP